MRVIRESPRSTANPAPCVWASTIIVRSFSTSNVAPSRPTRSWRKKTGPPSSSRIASAAAASTGAASVSPTPAPTTSSVRFATS